MNRKISNPSFTSNIVIVPKQQLNKIMSAKNVTIVSEMGNFKEVKPIRFIAATKGMICCVAGIFSEAKSNLTSIFHAYPIWIFGYSGENTANIAQTSDVLANFARKGNLKGIAVGSFSPQKFMMYIHGKRVVDFLTKPFKKNKGIDFSLFLYQKLSKNGDFNTAESAFAYDKLRDTFYLNCVHTRTNDKLSYKDIMTPEGIRDFFGFIRISPKDKVFIGGRQIPNEFFNKSALKAKEELALCYA